MIVYPEDWHKVGQEIELADIEDVLLEILAGIHCDNLSFSGGIDSSLLLYYLLKLGRKVKTFTVGIGENHPDVDYARMVIVHFERTFQVKIGSEAFIIPDRFTGDVAVAKYYDRLSHKIDSIIAGDGVDEFMAGYYAHQEMPSDEVYYGCLRRLQYEHLMPLNENSGKVKVYLPYIDRRLIYLMSQIPLEDKVDYYDRKKLMVELAQGKLPQEVIERKKYGFCTSSEKVAV